MYVGNGPLDLIFLFHENVDLDIHRVLLSTWCTNLKNNSWGALPCSGLSLGENSHLIYQTKFLEDH